MAKNVNVDTASVVELPVASATENGPSLFRDMLNGLQCRCDSLDRRVLALNDEQTDRHRELVRGHEKLLCVQEQQSEQISELLRTARRVDLGLANLMHEWQQWHELQTRFLGEHMKLLQTRSIITSLQSVTNVPSSSSGSGNPVSVVEQAAHTHSEREDCGLPRRRLHPTPNHKVRVPTFDGKGSWGACYLQFSRIAARNGWGEADRLERLIDSLRDKALEYLSILNGATQNAFERLVEAMEGRFGGQVGKGVVRRMLQEFEQKPGENFEELADRARVLIREAFPHGNDEVAEDLSVDAFVKALSDKRVALTIMDKGPTRLNDAVTMACTISGNRRVFNHCYIGVLLFICYEVERSFVEYCVCLP